MCVNCLEAGHGKGTAAADVRARQMLVASLKHERDRDILLRIPSPAAVRRKLIELYRLNINGARLASLDLVRAGAARVVLVDSERQHADVLTQPRPLALFKRHRRALMNMGDKQQGKSLLLCLSICQLSTFQAMVPVMRLCVSGVKPLRLFCWAWVRKAFHDLACWCPGLRGCKK